MVIADYKLTAYCLAFGFCSIFLGVGCYLFLDSLIDIYLNNDLKLINEIAASDRNRLLTVKLVGDIIGIHSFAKKLSVCFCGSIFAMHFKLNNFPCLSIRSLDDFASIYQIPLLTAFVWSLVTICSAMLLIQMQMVKSLFVSYVISTSILY